VDDLSRLLLDARDGDDAALVAVIRRSQPEIWRFCSYMVDRSTADDLSQEVYLRAWRALPRFRAECSARTWLLSIARRTCVDERRRRDRRGRLLTRLWRDRPLDEPAPTVEIGLVLDGLGNERRTAFLLTQVLGLSYEEAAEVCDCPIGTVRSRVARARADLIQTLGPEMPVRRVDEGSGPAP
jgi:RNA polymerase sigma-70 factor (ECF subfamily)